MLIPLLVALQLNAATPDVRIMDRASIRWRTGAPPYEVLLEESVPLRGAGGTTVFAVFGWAYASDPHELILVGFDSMGNPRLGRIVMHMSAEWPRTKTAVLALPSVAGASDG
jgi:hypothetical protein